MSFTVNIDAESNLSLETETTHALRQLKKFASSLDVKQYTIKSKQSNFVKSEESLLHDFIQTAPEAIITTGYDGRIKSINGYAECVFGYRSSEITGEHVAALFEPRFPVEPSFIRNQLSEPSSWRCITLAHPIRGRKKSGELFAVEILQRDIVLGGLPVLVFYVNDISERMRREQRIAELEREVSFLSRHSMLGELATAITHELSQPLTAITNYTAAAGRCWKKSTAEGVENGLALISKAGDQAKRAWLIMHRLRQLLQHRGGDFICDDLRLAVNDAVELATLGAAQHEITVEVDLPAEPVVVRMDRIQIQIIIANFIRNAVDELRAVEGERRIWISLKTDNQGEADVSVADTGPGIPETVFENIFDPFLTTKPEGLGVGLAVSRRIAQAHGGRLAARNRPEGGAVFSFIVPVSMSGKIQNE